MVKTLINCNHHVQLDCWTSEDHAKASILVDSPIDQTVQEAEEAKLPWKHDENLDLTTCSRVGSLKREDEPGQSGICAVTEISCSCDDHCSYLPNRNGSCQGWHTPENTETYYSYNDK